MTRILTLGMAVVDFVFQMDRFPEAAIKYKADDAMLVGGGCAANAAFAIARLDGQAQLLTRLGDDGIGRMIVADLEAAGVDCTGAQMTQGARSAFSSVYLDGRGERQIMNFRGHGLTEATDWIAAGAAPFDAALADTRWVAGARVALELARARGVPGVLDAEAPCAPELVRAASHVAFSEQGLADFTGSTDPEAGLHLARAQSDAWLAVTCGADGVWSLDGDQLAHHPGFQVEVRDTLGAGDIWHGAFALALGQGRAEADAVRVASAAAALKCTRAGGRDGAPTAPELQAFLKETGTWN